MILSQFPKCGKQQNLKKFKQKYVTILIKTVLDTLKNIIQTTNIIQQINDQLFQMFFFTLFSFVFVLVNNSS